jgi:hypothetical protein
MRIEYSADTDTALIEFSDQPAVETRKLSENVYLTTKILPEPATIVTARGTVGSNCMLAGPMTMNQANCGLKAVQGADYTEVGP